MEGAAGLGAEFGFQGAEVAALPQLAAVFVHHFEVHEKVGAQHVKFEVGAFDVQAGFVAGFFQQHIGQAACAKHFGRRQCLRQSGGALGQGHKAAAGALRQAFQQRLNLVFQHAGHQPLGAIVADLVQHKQGHGHGQTVFAVAGRMQILGGAVHATQAHHFWKGLRGDAHGLVAHQGFAGHE